MKIFGDNYETYDGTAVRDYLHISDFANLIVEILTNGLSSKSLILNAGTGVGKSVLDVMSIVNEFLQIPVRAKIVDKMEGDVASRIANIDLVKQVYDWEPQIDIESGIELEIKRSFK